MNEFKANTMTQAPPGEEQRVSPAHSPSEHSAAEQKAPRSRVVRIFLIVGIVFAALVIWKVFFATPSLPADIVALSGRIEGDDSAVAPKTSGKILEVTVREGDTVSAGQVIARLDDAQVRAQEDAARAALADAQAKSQGARDQIAVLQQQLAQNQVETSQSSMDAEGRIRQAPGSPRRWSRDRSTTT